MLAGRRCSPTSTRTPNSSVRRTNSTRCLLYLLCSRHSCCSRYSRYSLYSRYARYSLYSLYSLHLPGTTHELDKLPAVFFHYDISPIMAKVSVVTVVTAVTVVFQYELSPIMAKVSLVTVVSTHPPRWSTTMVPPAVRRHESSLARGRLFLTCLHPLAHQVTCSPPHPPSGDRGASLPLDLPHRAVRHRGRRLHRRGHARLLPLPPRQAQRQPVSSP